MNKSKKMFISLLLVLTLIMSSTFSSFAATSQTKAVYDLQQGGTQTFVLTNENGSIETVTIEQISSKERVESGVYKVTYNTLSWMAGFYVVVSNNTIGTAYSPFHSVATGSIHSTSLIVNNSTKATYAFIYKQALLSYDTGVIASISNSELTVSKR